MNSYSFAHLTLWSSIPFTDSRQRVLEHRYWNDSR